MGIRFTFTATLTSLALASPTGCATQRGLDELQAEQHHELYTRCVDTQMKQVSFGNGMAVHQACLSWTQSLM